MIKTQLTEMKALRKQIHLLREKNESLMTRLEKEEQASQIVDIELSAMELKINELEAKEIP